MGTNTLEIYTGGNLGDMRAGMLRRLRPEDAEALAALSSVDSATPNINLGAMLRFGNIAVNAQVTGVGHQYFRVRGTKLAEGSFFGPRAVERLEQVVVIDDNTRKRLFPDPRTDPIGQVVLLNNVACRVIGVTAQQNNNMLGGGGTSLAMFAPYSTVMGRMMSQAFISSITVRVADDTPMDAAEAAITRILTVRQGGQKSFFIQNSDSIRATVQSTTRMMTLLIGSIAGIALLVGGLGVMKIMLVSVTERTREIGVRMAVGARQGDILQQFLFEAVLVCLVGGALRVLLAMGISALASMVIASMVSDFTMVVSAEKYSARPPRTPTPIRFVRERYSRFVSCVIRLLQVEA
jgi:macrolide transport system ATP-binding/permease protein